MEVMSGNMDLKSRTTTFQNPCQLVLIGNVPICLFPQSLYVLFRAPIVLHVLLRLFKHRLKVNDWNSFKTDKSEASILESQVVRKLAVLKTPEICTSNHMFKRAIWKMSRFGRIPKYSKITRVIYSQNCSNQICRY